MSNIFYMSFAVILSGLFIYLLRLQGLQRFSKQLLLLVIAALAYDNAVAGTGFLLGEGQLLKMLSIPRFMLHVFVTPLIIVICLEIARLCRVPAALSPAAGWLVWLFYAALVAVGYFQEIFPMDFVPRRLFGVLTYSHTKMMPPIAAIVVNLFVLAGSVYIWRQTRWPVLFITSMCMLLLGSMPPKYFGFIPGNIGEIIFVAGFLLALKRFKPEDRTLLRSSQAPAL